MFAILIAPENLPKIQEHQAELPQDRAHFTGHLYLASKVNWYYVRGIVDILGKASWSTYPEEFFGRTFVYDEDKIKTEWDQIVHK